MFYVCKKPLICENKLLLTRKKSVVTKIDKIRGCALPPQKKSGKGKIATAFKPSKRLMTKPFVINDKRFVI